MLHDALSADSRSKLSQKGVLDLIGTCLVFKYTLQVLDLHDLVADASVGHLAEEIVDDLFFLLNLLFVFIELQEGEHAGNYALLLHVEVLLVSLHGSLQLLVLRGSPLLETLPLIKSALPGLKLLPEVYVLLLDDFHVKDSGQCLLLAVPLVEHRVYRRQIQPQISELQLLLGKYLLLLLFTSLLWTCPLSLRSK